MSPPALDPRRWRALALLALAQFVVVLDASIMNIALPSIGRGLHFSLANLSWVVNAYVLTFGGFLLLGGRIADLLGRRRVFVVGLGVFSLASLAGGLAQSEAWLIGARAVQGLGAAMLAPAALSLVTATFAEGTERNKALSIWGAVAGSGAAAGVLLGGVLTSALGWRSVLFVNVPIGIVAILIAPRLLSESKGQLLAASTSPARPSSLRGCPRWSTRWCELPRSAGVRPRRSRSSRPQPCRSSPSSTSSGDRRHRWCRSRSSATAT
jgi:MFS family permease